MTGISFVDDDRVLSTLVASLLKEKGYKTFVAYDAIQAMMAAKHQPPVDAIVLDVNMPGGSGEETLKGSRIRRTLRTSP